MEANNEPAMSPRESHREAPANESGAGPPRTLRARCPQCFSRRGEAVERFAPLASTQPWCIVRCADCGQMYTNPRPPYDDWEQYYPEDYPAHQLHKKPVRWHSGLRRFRDRCLLQLYRGYWMDRPLSRRGRWLALLLAPALTPFLDPYILPRHGEGHLLDFGCGNGRYLARMQALGWDVVGIDRSARVAEQARRHFGVPVIVGTVPTAELPARRFDLITAWEVLEHTDRPRQTLAGLRPLLCRGGRLVLTVPNQDGWGARLFGPAWAGLDLPRHLHHFTPASLSAMLRAEGFRVVTLTTLSHSGWLRHSARRAAALGLRRPCRLFASKTLSRLLSHLAVRRGAAESIYVVAEPAD